MHLLNRIISTVPYLNSNVQKAATWFKLGYISYYILFI